MSETKTQSTQSTKLVIFGDIHCGNSGIYPNKQNILKKILLFLSNNPETVILITGDLTDDGYGKGTCCFFPCATSNNCSNEDQSDTFITQVYEPIANITNRVFCCHGNHDEGNSAYSYPIIDWIKKTYNSTKNGFYNFQLNNLMFVCLGKYPDKEALLYLSQVILQSGTDKPYVLFFHYNIVGEWSQFWTDIEKQNFLSFIDENKLNVSCICHGHIHATYNSVIQTPNQTNLITLCGSSLDSCIVVDIDDVGKITNYSSV
jgi:UDP-2,3-diacylglucosamine pyrophosphatase LpxH